MVLLKEVPPEVEVPSRHWTRRCPWRRWCPWMRRCFWMRRYPCRRWGS
jgi:hypothetical protein